MNHWLEGTRRQMNVSLCLVSVSLHSLAEDLILILFRFVRSEERRNLIGKFHIVLAWLGAVQGLRKGGNLKGLSRNKKTSVAHCEEKLLNVQRDFRELKRTLKIILNEIRKKLLKWTWNFHKLGFKILIKLMKKDLMKFSLLKFII